MTKEEQNEMVEQLAAILRSLVNTKAGKSGLRISFEWILDVLDGDELLTRRVLTAAGFTPPLSTEWFCGRGKKTINDVCYDRLLADNLTDVLDLFDRDAAA